MAPGQSIEQAIRRAAASGAPALIGFLTAGFPDREGFGARLVALSDVADVIEVGVPFSDPMADGATIQRASRVALEQGVTLAWILEELARLRGSLQAPVLLMSYLNPLLAFGLQRLPRAAAEAGIAGFIVPDLPWEECAELREALNREEIALAQMVTPLTPPDRLASLARASQGFVYAVTATGITGSDVAVSDTTLRYLDLVRAASTAPTCAGFGIRNAAQVARVAGHVHGLVIGSALIEAFETGIAPSEILRSMRVPPAFVSADGKSA
jgi:tryptophan synthase alpha chain